VFDCLLRPSLQQDLRLFSYLLHANRCRSVMGILSSMEKKFSCAPEPVGSIENCVRRVTYVDESGFLLSNTAIRLLRLLSAYASTRQRNHNLRVCTSGLLLSTMTDINLRAPPWREPNANYAMNSTNRPNRDNISDDPVANQIFVL
jgi:hypothetical protein